MFIENEFYIFQNNISNQVIRNFIHENVYNEFDEFQPTKIKSLNEYEEIFDYEILSILYNTECRLKEKIKSYMNNPTKKLCINAFEKKLIKARLEMFKKLRVCLMRYLNIIEDSIFIYENMYSIVHNWKTVIFQLFLTLKKFEQIGKLNNNTEFITMLHNCFTY